MAGGAQYKTKQGEQLLAYLRTTKGVHITANDISAYFQSKGERIGVATIYRQLERLVEGGLVNKYYLAQANGAYFEYIDKEGDCGERLCFHCKCEHCGTLIHLKCKELEQIQRHLLNGHGFVLNPIRTVFYGVCDACAVANAAVSEDKSGKLTV